MTQDPRTNEFLETLLEAVGRTFSIGAQLEVTAGKSRTRAKGESLPVEVAGVVGLLGIDFQGTMMIAFPVSTYLKVMSRMLQFEVTEMGEAVQDGAAEVLNMILGDIKSVLNEKGFGLKLAIPSMIHGKELQVHLYKHASVIIPYQCEVGEFFMEFVIGAPEDASEGAPES